MATNAADGFARHTDQPRTHHLQSATFFVERLNAQRGVGGEFKHAGAVFFHIYRTMEHAHVPRTFHTNGVVTTSVTRCIFIVEDAQLLDLALRHAIQGLLTTVDVGHVNITGLLGEVNTVGTISRRGQLLQRDGFVVVGIWCFPEGEHVVVDVDQHDAPRRSAIILHSREDEFVIQRTGVEEVRLDVIDQLVLGDVFNRLATEGELVDRALRFDTALGHVKEDQFALTCHAMVTGDDTDKLGGAARDILVIEDGVRPIAVGTVELLLVGAVRVHRHQHAGEVVRRVGVFPTHEDHAAIGIDFGVPVNILVEGDTARRLAILFNQLQVGHIVAARDARHAVEANRCGGNDAAIREVTSIVVVHFGVRIFEGLGPV